jgi:hypothetical protein
MAVERRARWRPECSRWARQRRDVLPNTGSADLDSDKPLHGCSPRRRKRLDVLSSVRPGGISGALLGVVGEFLDCAKLSPEHVPHARTRDSNWILARYDHGSEMGLYEKLTAVLGENKATARLRALSANSSSRSRFHGRRRSRKTPGTAALRPPAWPICSVTLLTSLQLTRFSEHQGSVSRMSRSPCRRSASTRAAASPRWGAGTYLAYDELPLAHFHHQMLGHPKQTLVCRLPLGPIPRSLTA